MFKILAIQPENGFYAGGWPSNSAIAMAIVIIPNWLKMFNEN
jgi:hypothetical protein